MSVAAVEISALPDFCEQLCQARLQLLPEPRASSENEQPARPPLSAEQQSLVTEHLYLIEGSVDHMRRRFGKKIEPEEAMGDASEGLCLAAQRFDPSRQVKFSTYATIVTRGAIINGQRRYNRLGGPNRNKARVVSLLNNTRARSLDEEMTPRTASNRQTSPFTLHDVLPGDEPAAEDGAIANMERRGFYENLQLTDRQRQVLKLKCQRFTLREIASFVGISASTVSCDFRVVTAQILARYHPRLFEPAEI